MTQCIILVQLNGEILGYNVTQKVLFEVPDPTLKIVHKSCPFPSPKNDTVMRGKEDLQFRGKVINRRTYIQNYITVWWQLQQ